MQHHPVQCNSAIAQFHATFLKCTLIYNNNNKITTIIENCFFVVFYFAIDVHFLLGRAHCKRASITIYDGKGFWIMRKMLRMINCFPNVIIACLFVSHSSCTTVCWVCACACVRMSAWLLTRWATETNATFPIEVWMAEANVFYNWFSFYFLTVRLVVTGESLSITFWLVWEQNQQQQHQQKWCEKRQSQKLWEFIYIYISWPRLRRSNWPLHSFLIQSNQWWPVFCDALLCTVRYILCVYRRSAIQQFTVLLVYDADNWNWIESVLGAASPPTATTVIWNSIAHALGESFDIIDSETGVDHFTIIHRSLHSLVLTQSVCGIVARNENGRMEIPEILKNASSLFTLLSFYFERHYVCLYSVHSTRTFISVRCNCVAVACPPPKYQSLGSTNELRVKSEINSWIIELIAGSRWLDGQYTLPMDFVSTGI